MRLLSQWLIFLFISTSFIAQGKQDGFAKSNKPTPDVIKFDDCQLPKIKFIASQLMCGEKTTLISVEITGADPMLWTGGTSWNTDKPDLLTFSEKTNTSVKVSVTEWGDYKLFFHLEMNDGCDTTQLFNIGFYDTPKAGFTLSGEEGTCRFYNRVLNVTAESSPFATYEWDYGNSDVVGSISSKTFIVSLGYGDNQKIRLVVDDNGCRDTFSLDIPSISDLIVNTEPVFGCDSMDVSFYSKLGNEQNIEYIWTFGDGLSETSQNPTHPYNAPNKYSVGLNIKNKTTGCKSKLQFKELIKIFPTPVANFNADPTICYNDSIELKYLNSTDSTFCYWNINDKPLLLIGRDTAKVAIKLPNTKITLAVEEGGCLSEAVTKIVKRKPQVNFVAEVEEGCQPLAVEMIAETDEKNVTFSWLTDQTPNPVGITNLFNFPDSGRFDVGLIAYSEDTGCKDTLIKSGFIKVHPKPTSDFDIDNPDVTIENASVHFINMSVNDFTSSWDFGDGISSTLKYPQHIYSSVGEFNTRLITQSEFGCLDTSNVKINVLPFSVYTPNAFRPDSDIPENRLFMPVGLRASPERFNVKIFDRWGMLVFESDNPENKWDGKMSNGKNAPMGNYVWIAVYYDILGLEHKQNGQVLLIR